jgi:YVTN family beta-propeller protein
LRGRLARVASHAVSSVIALAATTVLTLSSLTAPAAGFDTYVTNIGDGEGDGFVSVVDSGTNRVAASPLPVGGYPYSVQMTGDGTRAYFVDRDAGDVSAIDTATNTVAATINVGSVPTNLVITPDGARVYVATWGSDEVSAIDTATNTLVARIPVAGGPFAIAMAPNGSRVYVTGRENGRVTAIDTTSNTVVGSVRVSARAGSIAITPDGRRAYVVAHDYADDEHVVVLDTATHQLLGISIDVPGNTSSLEITPDGTRAYVALYSGDSVSVLDIASNTLGANIAVGEKPGDLKFTPDGTRAYVANFDDGTISVIDTRTERVSAEIDVGGAPSAIAIAPRPASYAALGDSYSSGEGSPPYRGDCRRSREAWPNRFWAQSNRFSLTAFLACSGARIPALTGRFRGEQAQIRRIPTGTELATVTIGGNDVGFANVLATCFAVHCTYSLPIREARRKIASIAPKLARAYKSISAKLTGRARLFVVGYPRVFRASAPSGAAGSPTSREKR